MVTASVGVPVTDQRRALCSRSRTGRFSVSEWPAPDCSSCGATIHTSSLKWAAIEGALAGIRSVALSQVYSREGMADRVPFDTAEAWGPKTLEPLLGVPFAPRTMINVNFPPVAADEFRGIKVVRQGFHDYARGSVVEGTDPRGYRYYWFGLHGIEHTPGHATDLEAIADGYVSVTPLQLDFTHEASLAEIAGRYG
jgi:5'-nucleotidase